MFATLSRRLVPIYVLAAVLAVPLIQHAWQLYAAGQSGAYAAAQLAHHATKAVTGEPSRIVVPSATIDLPVVTGSQDMRTHVWSVNPTQANYADVTAQPNTQSGRTLIYGHNNHKVFARLLGLKKHAVAYVYTSNRHLFAYRYDYSKDIAPSQTQLFKQLQQGVGLALMTCDGPHFQYRHIMFFSLVKAT